MRPLIISIMSIVIMLGGCSGINSPLISDDDLSPVKGEEFSAITGSDGYPSSVGLMGVYDLSIDPETQTADLVSKRDLSIGEDYLVSGIGFFQMTPCADCLKIKGISVIGEGIRLIFEIKHPFMPGDISKPPSASNRRDLNVFDLAMIVVPTGITPASYPVTGIGIYRDTLANADGYTTELKNAAYNNATAMPYVLVIDESDTVSHTWNKFAMGSRAEFDVDFILTTGTPLKFTLYLTMGYGSSAKKPQRLDPKYYNPEFNCKAAWKVNVIPPQGEDPPALGNTWNSHDSTTPFNVTVEVYDWQTDAIVSTEPDFADADPSHVFSASEVESVSVEIPGMNYSPQVASTPTSGLGMPREPLIYTIPIANENLLGEGEYVGIVKVTDERLPLTPNDGRDFLIDSPDGIQLNNYVIPEYSTYQTFVATVVYGFGPVGNVTVTTNRTSSTKVFLNSGPWTLHWNPAPGAVEYAIYWDNDPSDGLTNNLQFVGTTTSTSYTVPGSHLSNSPAKMTYIVRSRSILGDPLSEAPNSEPAFIMTNRWTTLNEDDVPGRGNTGEGWNVAVQNYYGVYNYNPYIVIPISSDKSCRAISEMIGHSNCGSYQGILIQTPTIPDSSVRFLEFAGTFFSIWASQGLIIGSCSSNPGAPWSTPLDFEWALASNASPYYGYNSQYTAVRTTFDGVDDSSNYCWRYTSAVWFYAICGGDINATANPNDPYVGIMGATSSYSGTNPPWIYADDMAIMIY